MQTLSVRSCLKIKRWKGACELNDIHGTGFGAFSNGICFIRPPCVEPMCTHCTKNTWKAHNWHKSSSLARRHMPEGRVKSQEGVFPCLCEQTEALSVNICRMVILKARPRNLLLYRVQTLLMKLWGHFSGLKQVQMLNQTFSSCKTSIRSPNLMHGDRQVNNHRTASFSPLLSLSLSPASLCSARRSPETTLV